MAMTDRTPEAYERMIAQRRERRRREREKPAQPTLAPRCSCEKPFFYDDDGHRSCIHCGKRP
jgi:hypothetical protein